MEYLFSTRYMDDIILIADSNIGLQQIIDKVVTASQQFGIKNQHKEI